MWWGDLEREAAHRHVFLSGSILSQKIFCAKGCGIKVCCPATFLGPVMEAPKAHGQAMQGSSCAEGQQFTPAPSTQGSIWGPHVLFPQQRGGHLVGRRTGEHTPLCLTDEPGISHTSKH